MSLDARLRTLADEHDPVLTADELDDALRWSLALGHQAVVRRRVAMAAAAVVAVLGIGAAVLAAANNTGTTETDMVDSPPDPPPVVEPPVVGQFPTTTTTTTPGAAEPVGGVPKPGEPLTTGRYFVFVRAVDTKAGTVTVDVAQWFEGEEAEKAAAEDQDESNNDYYIRNTSFEVRTVRVAKNAPITVYGGDPNSGRRVSLAGLADEVRRYNGEVIAWIDMSGGQVERLEQQWVP